MDRNTLSLLALVVTILYGVGFALIGEDSRTPYAAIGGGIIAICWIAVGTLGRDPADGA